MTQRPWNRMDQGQVEMVLAATSLSISYSPSQPLSTFLGPLAHVPANQLANKCFLPQRIQDCPLPIGCIAYTLCHGCAGWRIYVGLGCKISNKHIILALPIQLYPFPVLKHATMPKWGCVGVAGQEAWEGIKDGVVVREVVLKVGSF